MKVQTVQYGRTHVIGPRDIEGGNATTAEQAAGQEGKRSCEPERIHDVSWTAGGCERSSVAIPGECLEDIAGTPLGLFIISAILEGKRSSAPCARTQHDARTPPKAHRAARADRREAPVTAAPAWTASLCVWQDADVIRPERRRTPE